MPGTMLLCARDILVSRRDPVLSLAELTVYRGSGQVNKLKGSILNAVIGI